MLKGLFEAKRAEEKRKKKKIIEGTEKNKLTLCSFFSSSSKCSLQVRLFYETISTGIYLHSTIMEYLTNLKRLVNMYAT